MGIEWKGADFKQSIEKATEEKYWKLFDGVLDVGLEALEVVKPIMEYVIDTTTSAIVPPKPHRNYTVKMRDSLETGSLAQVGKNVYSASAGWVNVFKRYFGVQDQGGMSNGLRVGDREIWPMHALATAYFEFREELEDGLGHIRA